MLFMLSRNIHRGTEIGEQRTMVGSLLGGEGGGGGPCCCESMSWHDLSVHHSHWFTEQGKITSVLRSVLMNWRLFGQALLSKTLALDLILIWSCFSTLCLSAHHDVTSLLSADSPVRSWTDSVADVLRQRCFQRAHSGPYREGACQFWTQSLQW